MNAVFEKTMENIRNQRDIKLRKAETTRNYLFSERNYHATKFFSENSLVTEMKRTQILLNQNVYLVLSILEKSKTAVYKFWYDYAQPKYGKNKIMLHEYR